MTLRPYLHHIPAWITPLLPQGLEWRMPAAEKEVYLTFDDGPHPEITPWVLEQLAEAGACATFFMIGHRVAEFPETARKVWNQGQGIGNHTFTHKRGSSTSDQVYLAEIKQTQEAIQEVLGVAPRWFRPPYGSIRRSQVRLIRPDFRIAMMDVIPGDFDVKMDTLTCLKLIQKYVRPGSVVVLHDSEKAFPRLEQLLPEVLAWLREAGYGFRLLPDSRAVGNI